MRFRTAVYPAHPDRIVPLLLAALLALTALATITPAVSAQEQTITFRILKLDCEEDPGQVPDGLTPEGCAPAEGVAFTIEVEGVEDPLTCTTNAEGRCQVDVPSEAMVTVTEDETTATEGYSPRENPIETQAVTEFAGAIFVNVADQPAATEPAATEPAATEEPEATQPPTTDLPDTGAGTSTSAGPIAVLAMLAAVLLLGGTLLRRHVTR